MSDADLDEIRRARLQQLREQGGGQTEEKSNQDQQRQREADARQTILNQILEPDAADRLGRIRMVKEQRAVDVENHLIMLARSGQLRQKINEAQLKDILNAASETQDAQEKVVVKRTKGTWDDDDDLLNDL